jgi:acyl-CoA reductase-like NAD-dependent aldehyde dehydrogenase
MAEMLEGKADEAVSLLSATVPGGARRSRREVERASDRLVAYAGWADKFSQVLGNSNPVAGPFYNFTIPESMGVVGVVAPNEEPLLGLISMLAPVLCSGNTVVALGSEEHPLLTSFLGEVCATSDVPPGVLNLLTGIRSEVLEVMPGYRDLEGIHAAGCSTDERTLLELGSSENMKRVAVRSVSDWYDNRICESPYWIESFVEMKTIWHPSSVG